MKNPHHIERILEKDVKFFGKPRFFERLKEMKIIGVERINKIVLNLLELTDNRNEKSSYKKVIYINYGLNLISKKGLLILIHSLVFRKKIIVHWIGSDVYSLLQDSGKSKVKLKILVNVNKLFDITNWVAAPLLKNEFEEYGISSEVVYIPTELVKEVEITPLPSEPSFVSYLPESNHSFYGSELIFQLAKKNPEIIINIVANDGIGLPQMDNIVYHGWVDQITMNEIYENNYGVIRIPEHDALGGTVIEAVLRGRYAIWSFEAPYVYGIKNYDELEKSVYSIIRKTSPNFSGAKYIQEHYNYEKLKSDFIQRLNDLI